MQGNAFKKLLAGKKYLLLQWPMGPFFNDLAEYLESTDKQAVNVVFNGGDRFYCRQRKYLSYLQTPQEFPAWLGETHKDYAFDTIQIKHHSPYNDVREYINEVMQSFAEHAPKDTYLVIKHHPMDRGHRLYSPRIKKLSKVFGVVGRVIYVHDLPLLELLTHTKGVVTINSTMGISALIHGKPVKVMGDAFYDINYITFQNKLNIFWQSNFTPNVFLVNKMKRYLLINIQVSQTFYF
jgi:capsular polysaccharide export protein